jgi:YwiC-like protein
VTTLPSAPTGADAGATGGKAGATGGKTGATGVRAGATGATAARGRPRARARRQFVPPQHGAWAMLLLPYLAAITVTGPRWPHLTLLAAWLTGYLASYYALQAIKARRLRRVRVQLLTYAALAVPLTAVTVAARPEVARYAPAYALLLAVNAGYAWLRRERALLNDLASVLQSCLIVFVVAAVAGVGAGRLLGVFAAVLAYFVGTVLYVKTMIRERDSAAYRRASIAYHAVALAAAVPLGPLVAGVFALLLARAWALPGRRLAPKRVGVIEIANCVLLLAAVAATWA